VNEGDEEATLLRAPPTPAPTGVGERKVEEPGRMDSVDDSGGVCGGDRELCCWYRGGGGSENVVLSGEPDSTRRGLFHAFEVSDASARDDTSDNCIQKEVGKLTAIPQTSRCRWPPKTASSLSTLRVQQVHSFGLGNSQDRSIGLSVRWVTYC
jgi:hypothetical protein